MVAPFFLRPPQYRAASAQAQPSYPWLLYGGAVPSGLRLPIPGMGGAEAGEAAGADGTGGIAGALQALSAGMAFSHQLTGGILGLIRASREMASARRYSRAFRGEARALGGGLIGAWDQELDPYVAIAQRMLRTPPRLTRAQIGHLEALHRLQSPQAQALLGPATGASLARALPAMDLTAYLPTLQTRMTAIQTNEQMLRDSAARLAQWEAARSSLAARYVR